MEICLVLPAFDADGQKLAGLDQFLDAALHVGRREPEIVAQVARCGDAECAGRNAQQFAVRVGGFRDRRIEDGGRQHALGQIVEPLEAAARMGGDASGPEQPFEGVLLVAPAPPAAGTLCAVDVGGRDRAACGDFPIDVLDQAGMFAAPFGQSPIHFLAPAGALHAPAHQRICLDRQERRLVRPIFEQPALASRSRIVQQRHRIRPEPRKQRHVVRPHHGADRIDLQQADAGKDPVQMTAIDRARRARIGEPLRGQRDAPRRGERYLFPHYERVLTEMDGEGIMAGLAAESNVSRQH